MVHGEGVGAVDVHALEVFVRAYESDSFTEAARRGFVTRQAFSKAVTQLEREIGPLFEREARGVRPTELADAVYPHARRALEEIHAIEDEARRFSEGQSGHVTFALETNAMLTLPTDIMAAYDAARPHLGLTSLMLPGGMVFEALEQERADAVVAGPFPVRGYEFWPILSSTLAIVFLADLFAESGGPDPTGHLAHADSSAAHDESPAVVGADVHGRYGGVREASGEPLVLGPEALAGKTIFGVAPTNRVETELVTYLVNHGIDARVTYACADTALATAGMEAGAGGIIVEESSAFEQFHSSRYALVPLCGEDAPIWEIGVTCREGSLCEAVARDFASFARDYAHSVPTKDR